MKPIPQPVDSNARHPPNSEAIQDGPLPEPLNLPVHLPGQHQAEHLVIAQERPERVPERRGDVALHEQVAVPGEAVPGEGDQEEEPPVERGRVDQEGGAQERSREVPPPRGRLRVLGHVEGPELVEAPKIHLLQGKKTPTQFSGRGKASIFGEKIFWVRPGR